MVTIRTFLATVAMLAFSQNSAATSQTDQIADSYSNALKSGQAYWNQEQIDQLQKPMLDLIEQLSGKEIQTKNGDHESAISEEILYKILITDAMGDDEIRSLITSLQHRKDISFVTKGFLPEDRTFGDISRRLFRLLSGLEEVPNISLDPRVFKELSATTAPIIAAYRGTELVAFANGIANPNWLADQIEGGKTGDLGNFGNVYNITEIAPEEVMAERAKLLDFEKIKQEAKDNYFKNIVFYGLPRAQETVTRRFKPVVTVNEPILDAEGNEVIAIGVTHNMLKAMPFSKRVVVFDATDKEQMEWVLALPPSDKPTKYITTRFDSSRKSDGLKSIEEALGASVYLLNQDVIKMFDLRVSPTIASADNDTKEFVISEFELRESK
jgi:conjugal transfer pilus assembly protein TraW